MKTSFAARYDFPLIAPETPSFMQQDVAKTPQDLEGADVVVIGAPYVAAKDGIYAGVPMEGLDLGHQTGAPAVGALSLGLHPGF